MDEIPLALLYEFWKCWEFSYKNDAFILNSWNTKIFKLHKYVRTFGFFEIYLRKWHFELNINTKKKICKSASGWNSHCYQYPFETQIMLQTRATVVLRMWNHFEENCKTHYCNWLFNFIHTTSKCIIIINEILLMSLFCWKFRKSTTYVSF